MEKKIEKTVIAYSAENRFGIEKKFNDACRAERYQLKEQIRLLCATVADQLRTELASAVDYAEKNKTIPEFKFDLKNRFKQAWRSTPSQIRSTITGDYLSVYEGETHAFGLYLKRLQRDWDYHFEKETYTGYFKKKIVGINPNRKLSKGEKAFFGMLEEMQDNGLA